MGETRAGGRIRKRVARVVQGAEPGARSHQEESPSDAVFHRGESRMSFQIHPKKSVEWYAYHNTRRK